MKTKNAVAYFYNSRFDTPLDKVGVQENMVYKWLKDNGYTLVEPVYDRDNRDNLSTAIQAAKDCSGFVIVASVTKLADEILDYLVLAKENQNIITIEEGDGELCPEAKHAAVFVHSTAMAIHERYISNCKRWVCT
jgi:hypothetical protein